MQSSAAESSAEGTIELKSGLQVALSVLTDGTGLSASDGGDHYELTVSGEAGSLTLDGFTSLRRTLPKKAKVITSATYGRQP